MLSWNTFTRTCFWASFRERLWIQSILQQDVSLLYYGNPPPGVIPLFFLLVKSSWITFVFPYFSAASGTVKGKAAREWEECETKVLMCCMFCTITAVETETDLLWASIFLNCRSSRQPGRAIGWRERQGTRSGGSRAAEESFYRFTLLFGIDVWDAQEETQTLRSACSSSPAPSSLSPVLWLRRSYL